MNSRERRLGALCQLGTRLAAVAGLEAVVDVTLIGLDELLGHRHSLLLVHQVETNRLVTLASRGYDTGGIGSEVALGEGVIGMAADKRSSMRIGNLQRMLRYARSVQRAAAGDTGPPGSTIRIPGLADARSQLAAPMIARDALLGVVAVESEAALAFDEVDEQILTVVGHIVGGALDREQVLATTPDDPTLPPMDPASPPPPPTPASASLRPILLRQYAVDGSIFLDGVYVIKGVAGRLLWKVAEDYVATGRTAFTNREARLDPALELPPVRDNFESRLILLKRRLEERGAPLHIVGAGRGRFEFRADAPVVLERVDHP
ncbi:MAG: GAF domain-containing protein [Actinomycetota bacterium]|nr:GAF domain-containing protein [Actinomycetota bacterium]